MAEPGSALTADEVLDFVGTRLARFKCPTVVIVGDLPHSVTGKVSRVACASLKG